MLRTLPTIKLARRPRMADFGRVLRAVDLELGTDGLTRYMEQRGELQREAAEGDRIGSALITWMTTRMEWEGTAHDLLSELTPDRPPKDWPQTPRALSGALRRVAQPLRAAGIGIDFTREPGTGRRLVSLRTEAQFTVTTVTPSQLRVDDRDGRDGSDGQLLTFSGWDENLAELATDDGEVVRPPGPHA